MLNRKRCVVIVDAFSSGRYLIPLWRETHEVVHVLSTEQLPEVFIATLDLSACCAEFKYCGDSEALLRSLSAYDIEFVQCGSEFGVELTDILASELGLIGNDPGSSSSRRDKYSMFTRLSESGLACPMTFRCRDVAEALSAYDKLICDNKLNAENKKFVVKPVNSAGSEDVYICTNRNELEEAAAQIIGKKNLMLCENSHFLVQEFLEGTEYIVNSVSADGHHYITDMWKSHKQFSQSGRLIYDFEELLDPHTAISKKIAEYMLLVLDSLSITWGPAHSELIFAEDGPKLLETGARLSGLANPAVLTLATGGNQVDLSAAAYRNRQLIIDRSGEHYSRRSACLCVNLIAHESGYIDRQEIRNALTSLKSFHSFWLRATSEQVKQTIDLNSSPGVVFLLDKDETTLEIDLEKIRKIEQVVYRASLA